MKRVKRFGITYHVWGGEVPMPDPCDKVTTAYNSNTREVWEWLKEHESDFECKCKEKGISDTCQLCASRLIPFLDGNGKYDHLDDGDTVYMREDTNGDLSGPWKLTRRTTEPSY